MIGKIISFLAVVAVAVSASAIWEDLKPMEGVDPNKVSCDSRGKEFLLLPHYKNCSRFYMCNHGAEVEFECAPGGLVFDFERQTCNWAWAIDCVLRDIVEVEEDGSGDDEAEFSVIGESAVKNGPVGYLTAESSGAVRPMAALSARQTYNAISLSCENAMSSAIRIPYNGDCQRYWKCEKGLPQTFYCTDGLFFNPASLQCDFEANVRCSVEIGEELNGEFMVYKE